MKIEKCKWQIGGERIRGYSARGAIFNLHFSIFNFHFLIYA